MWCSQGEERKEVQYHGKPMYWSKWLGSSWVQTHDSLEGGPHEANDIHTALVPHTRASHRTGTLQRTCSLELTMRASSQLFRLLQLKTTWRDVGSVRPDFVICILRLSHRNLQMDVKHCNLNFVTQLVCEYAFYLVNIELWWFWRWPSCPGTSPCFTVTTLHCYGRTLWSFALYFLVVCVGTITVLRSSVATMLEIKVAEFMEKDSWDLAKPLNLA